MHILYIFYLELIDNCSIVKGLGSSLDMQAEPGQNVPYVNEPLVNLCFSPTATQLNLDPTMEWPHISQN